MSTSMPVVGGDSPWGVIQTIRPTEDCGALHISTASHGGIWVPPDQLAKMAAELRCNHYAGGGSWFEEDCEWALVYFGLPGVFGDNGSLMDAAEMTIISCADAYPSAAKWLSSRTGGVA